MKTRRRRTILITVLVILAVIIISSIALRIIFTRERLLGILVPRAEKALEAEISVGDIGIEFPFGFGVEAENISFRKQLENQREIDFGSNQVSVKASLISLIRRKPRLSRVVVSGAAVQISDPGGMVASAEGMQANMSVNPTGENYIINYDLAVDSVMVVAGKGAEMRGVTGLTMKGIARTSLPSGRKEGELFPPSNLVTDIRIKKFILPLKLPKTDIKATLRLEGLEIESKDIKITSGRLTSDIDFRLLMSSAAEPRRLEFESRTAARIEELAKMVELEGPELAGSADLSLGGSVDLAEFRKDSLFREDVLSLKGRLELKDLSADAGGSMPAVSELNLQSDIDHYGAENIKTEFKLGGQPFSMEGSMDRVVPALMQLQQIIREGGGSIEPGNFGRIFGRLNSGSTIELRVSGTSFDARPLMKKDQEEKKGKDAGQAASKGFDISSSPAVANPFTVLILKDSTIEMELDTLLTPYGPLSDFEAVVEGRDGSVRIMPMKAMYAGGTIESASSADFSNLASIATVANLSAEKIDSRELLSEFVPSADIMNGKFDINGNGRVNLTPHADPVNSLHARAVLHSDGGGVNFSKFISPVSAATGLDLSRYEDFVFNSCDGDMVVSGGTVTIRKLEMAGGDGRIRGTGTVGFDKSLNLAASLIIPPDAQKRMKDLKKLGDIVEYFKDDQGNLVLTFIIGGTARSPSVSLDQSGIRERARQKLSDELKKKAVEKLKDLF